MTGPAVFPGLDQFPGTDQYPGQGEHPIEVIWYSTDELETDPPVWKAVNPVDILSFNSSRGSENELTEIDSGTAAILLRNQKRQFDPQRRNLLKNPSFEGSLSDWTATSFGAFFNPGAVLSLDMTSPVFGNYACRVVTTAAIALQGVKQFVAPNMIPGRTYTFSIHVKSVSGSTALTIALGGTGGVTFASTNITPNTVTTTRYSITYTAVADEPVLVAVRTQGATVADFIVDAAMWEESPFMTDYTENYFSSLNRWMLKEQFEGETQSIFTGYSKSNHLDYPGWGGSDATIEIPLVDEFHNLALDNTPVPTPPRDTYEEVIMYDNPMAYWRFTDTKLEGTVGPNWIMVDGYGIASTTAIVGDVVGHPTDNAGGSLFMTSGGMMIVLDGNLDHQQSASFTVEFWFMTTGTNFPYSMFGGPTDPTGPRRIWYFQFDGSALMQFNAYDSVGGLHSVSFPTPISINVWHHIAGIVDGSGNLWIFVDGVGTSVGSFNGSLLGSADTFDPNFPPYFSGPGSGSTWFDEVAVYNKNLGGARLLEHITAGRSRGFPTQTPGRRIGAALDVVQSHAPRRLDAGFNTLHGSFYAGKSPLEHARHAVEGEPVDTLFFVANDGAITFLASNHRTAGSTRWSTVQATFGDQSGELPVLSVKGDDTEQFLANEWNITREWGALATFSDPISKKRFKKRDKSLSDVPVTSSSPITDIGSALITKYSYPIWRYTEIVVTTQDPNVAKEVFRRDIGDKLRIIKTRPDTSRFTQDSWIRKIDVDASQRGRWVITLAVSPL